MQAERGHLVRVRGGGDRLCRFLIFPSVARAIAATSMARPRSLTLKPTNGCAGAAVAGAVPTPCAGSVTVSSARHWAVFHRQQGSHWFNLCLPDCDGLTTTVVRFSGPLTIKPVAGLFEITARVHIPDPRVLPKEDLEDRLLALIGIRDGSFNNPLHLFISTWSSLLSGGHHEY